MAFLIKAIKKLQDIFCIPQAPIGLKSMGIRAKYLNKINNFNYSNARFCNQILSPVKNPYFFTD